MPENVCKLQKGKPAPIVEIHVGYTHQCRYKLRQYDEDGQKKQVLADGVNTDNVPDKYTFSGPISKLDKKQLFWSLLLISISGPLGAYDARITIRQDGDLCPGGTFVYKGESENRLHEEVDGIRFIAV